MAEPLHLWQRLAPVMVYKTEAIEIMTATQRPDEMTEREQAETRNTQEENGDTTRGQTPAQSTDTPTQEGDIKRPGLWLEDPLTEAEITDIERMQEVLQELAKTGEKNADTVIDVVAPYLNSLMHTIYFLFKDYFYVKAVEDGVIYQKAPNDEKMYFNIERYTIDFALDNFFMLDEKAIEEEFYSFDEIPPSPGFKQRRVEERIDRIKAYVDSKSEKNIISLLQAVIPQYHVMPNNSLMNILTSKSAINAGAFDLTVRNKKGRTKEITAYTIVSCNLLKDSEGNLIQSSLTEYERQISDAIMSIWEQSRKDGVPCAFTVDMVYRAMPGSGDKPSPQQQGAITKAIEKLRDIHVVIDVTDEFRARHLISDKEERRYDDKYLSLGRETKKIKNGGQTVQTYILHSEPIVLSYCKLTGQLITVSKKWLEIKKVQKGVAVKQALPMTQERQALTGYLIRRIKVMQRDNENAISAKEKYDRKRIKQRDLPQKPLEYFRDQKSTVISFSSIYKDVIGTPEPSRDKALDIRKFCFQVLDYYKSAGLIPGYKEQKKGRSITGIEIIL